jgi:hypothetical protein
MGKDDRDKVDEILGKLFSGKWADAIWRPIMVWLLVMVWDEVRSIRTHEARITAIEKILKIADGGTNKTETYNTYETTNANDRVGWPVGRTGDGVGMHKPVYRQ